VRLRGNNVSIFGKKRFGDENNALKIENPVFAVSHERIVSAHRHNRPFLPEFNLYNPGYNSQTQYSRIRGRSPLCGVLPNRDDVLSIGLYIVYKK